MNPRFVLHALSFFAASTVALSLGQAWAIAGGSRRTSHTLVWGGVFALMLWLGMRVLGVHWSDPIMREGPVRRSLVTITAALAAASLGAGLAWGTSRKIETAPFSRRVLGLAQAHAAAVLIGGALAYVLLALIWISQIH
jgi:hypothetical protein